MNFDELQLDEGLAKGIAKAGYTVCTPVQEQVLTKALEGADLYVQSQTGTGKTAAYLITIIQQMMCSPKMKGKKALVMVPTRELAVQVEEEACTLASETGLKSASFYGGVGYTKQTSLLKKGVDIIIGTPGRLIDLQESGILDLSGVGFLVVDEADRMFDMGFYPDLRKLIKVLPKTECRQTMLFSATLNTYVKNLAWEYTDNAQEITIESENITVDEINQMLLHVSSGDKMKLLLGILKNEKPASVIIFCNTKRSCEVIAKRLRLNGTEAEFIIGDLPQAKRLQVLDSFKSGSLTCLVATDVAARGIDVDDLAMVVNFDLPNESENYVHRIGRTARAGKSGKAYTFCSEQDVYNLPAIERYLGNSIPSSVAFADMFAEDKSEGVYIKLDSYYDENKYDDSGFKQNRGKRGAKGLNRSSFGRYGERKSDGKSKKPRTKDDRRANKNSFVKGAAGSEAERRHAADMSSLSFEERMKLYREKYGSKQAQSGAEGSYGASDKTADKKRSGSKKHKNRSPKDYRNSPASRQASSARQTGGGRQADTSRAKAQNAKSAAPAQKKSEKKGFFSALKKLFTKR